MTRGEASLSRLDGAATDRASGGDAVLEKDRAEEEKVAPVRLTVVLFNGLLFATVVPGPDPIPWSAYGVLLLALAYPTWMVVAKPYREPSVLTSSVFVSVTDGILITGWLAATGGFGSPYFPLWYLSVFALSLRYGAWETVGGATGYTFVYAGLTAATEGLLANLPMLVLRTGYSYLAGALGTLVSLVAYEQTVDKQRYQGLAEQHKRTAEELRRTVSLHEATLDATADGSLVVDLDDNIVSYNERFQQMWGLPEEILASEDDEAARESVLDQLEEPGAFPQDVRGIDDDPEAVTDDELHLADGRVFARHSSPQYLDGKPVGRVWSFSDVTEQRRAQEALEQFAYAASHDIREPLRTTNAYLGLLERNLEDLDEDARTDLDEAHKGAQRLDRMVGSLLAYSQIDREGGPESEVDLGAVLDDALQNVKASLAESEARVDVGDLPVVRGNRDPLALVFQNLLSNAIKHDEPPVHVSVSARGWEDGGAWTIEVADDGEGIPRDEQEEIFDAFHRGSKANTSGVGMGLAICRRVLERHGSQRGSSRPRARGRRFPSVSPELTVQAGSGGGLRGDSPRLCTEL